MTTVTETLADFAMRPGNTDEAARRMAAGTIGAQLAAMRIELGEDPQGFPGPVEEKQLPRQVEVQEAVGRESGPAPGRPVARIAKPASAI